MSPTALRKLFQWLHDHPEGGYEERVTVNNLLTKDDDYIQVSVRVYRSQFAEGIRQRGKLVMSTSATALW